jgi:hypothetical protein
MTDSETEKMLERDNECSNLAIFIKAMSQAPLQDAQHKNSQLLLGNKGVAMFSHTEPPI